jgi:hypothetical protein
MFMDARMCECIVCMKEKLIKLKRVALGHQTFKYFTADRINFFRASIVNV